MRTQYASTPTPPPPTVAIVSGSTTAAVAGTKYLWIYCRNRVGVTAFSTRVDTAIAEGDALQITLPSTIRKAASDIHEIGIVLSTSNTPETGCVVATYPGFDIDGITPTALPAVITLSHNIHFQLFAVVATPANLPASNRINGMRRYVNSTAQFVAWSSQQSEWVLVRPQKFNPYVVTTTEEEGADVDLSKIEDYSLVITPDYDVSGSLSVPVVYWIVNDGSAEIPQGRRVRISCATTTGDAASDDFKGLMQITFLGYANTVTGALDITGMDVGSTQTYQGNIVTNLLLQKPLPANSAYALRVQMAFDYADARNSAYQGEVVKIYPYLASNYAEYDPAYSDLGDRIFPENGQRRILPNGPGLTLSAATGSGSIKFYKWLNVGQDEVFGATANTADQNVIVTNNGACFVAATVPDTAALRAVISSVDGIGHPTAWSAAIALDATKRLAVTLTHPTAIRTNYPDVIAGTTATLNASKIRIYVRVVGSGTITYFDAPILGTTGEEITVGSLTGTNIGSLPSVTASHGLFNLSSFTRSSVAGSSVFTTNNYEVAIAYLYENTITAISHDTALGCVLELGSTLTDAIAVSKIIGQTVADIAALRAVPEANISAWQVRYVISVENEYRFNPTSTAVDDGDLEIKPDDIILASPGRWEKILDGGFRTIQVAGQSNIVADSSSDTLTIAAGSGITLTTDAATDTLTITGSSVNNAFSTISVSGQDNVVADSSSDTLTLVAGTGITLTTNATTDSITINSTAANNTFSALAVAGQSNIVADSSSDTLTIAAGSGITLTTDPTTDTLTITGSSVSNTFSTISVSGQDNVVADSSTDTLTLVGGTGMTITTNAATDTITFASSGVSATVNVGTVTTLNPNQSPTVVNSGTTSAAILDFGLPSAATVSVGSVTTLTPGNSATVTNSGTNGNVVLNFSIPAGAAGSLTGGSGFILTPVGSPITTGVSEVGFYVDNADNLLKTRLASNGATSIAGSTQDALFLRPISAPTTPSTARALFTDTADGLLKTRDISSGTVRTLASLNRVQAYTATQYGTPSVQNISGSVILDGSAANVFILTLTGNVSNLTMNNVQVGATYIIYLIQDATGGRTVTLNSIFKRITGDTTTINTGANKVNLLNGIARASNAITLSPIAVEV